MTDRHRVLIIEDDRATAEDLTEFARALNCDPVVVDNKLDALAAFERDEICLVLLDLEIKREPGSLRGHFEVGNSLLREIRTLYSEHVDNSYRLPIIVVSGYVGERNAVLEIMKNGASDIIEKPLDPSDVSKRVRECLERSGRARHESCRTMPNRRSTVSGAWILSIPGDRTAQRTRILLRGTPVDLVDSDLRTLLHLVVAKIHGTRGVHKTVLGARDHEGFRGISNLRNALKPALPPGANIVGNDHAGNYWLTDDVAVSGWDADKLVAVEDATIARLVEQLRNRKV